MGSSFSKATRKLPPANLSKTKPAWAGARTGEPPVGSANPSASRAPPKTDAPHASEGRDAGTCALSTGHSSILMVLAIEADARDPQLSPEFMRNLGRLGQVRVDHGMSSVRAEATRTQELFRSRAATESGAQTGVEGPTLAILLGMRADGYDGLGRELKRVGMEAGALERVARYVNAPRVKSGSQKKRLDDQSVEHFEMEVCVPRSPMARQS
jgi:hypothetical protein